MDVLSDFALNSFLVFSNELKSNNENFFEKFLYSRVFFFKTQSIYLFQFWFYSLIDLISVLIQFNLPSLFSDIHAQFLHSNLSSLESFMLTRSDQHNNWNINKKSLSFFITSQSSFVCMVATNTDSIYIFIGWKVCI